MRNEKRTNRKKSNLHPETKKAVVAVLLFAFAILSFLSSFGLGGKIGNGIFLFLRGIFGWGVHLLEISLVVIGIILIKSFSGAICSITTVSVCIMFFSVLGIIQIVFGKTTGGTVGQIIGASLENMFDFTGGLIISFTVFLISLLVALNISLDALWNKFFRKPVKVPIGSSEEKGNNNNPEDKEKVENKLSMWNSIKKIIPASNFKQTKIREKINDTSETNTAPEIKKHQALKSDHHSKITGPDNYNGFSLDMLAGTDKNKSDSSNHDQETLEINSDIIKKTLKNFGIDVEMRDINVGPTVAQYTLKPAEGVKLSKIIALQNDLALALAAHPIRIEAPIPGKSLVGIEIPNKSTTLVRLKSILSSEQFRHAKGSLNFGLGLDVAGTPMTAALTCMPHMLIAGSTGSGKSVCINSIIISLLYANSPKQLRLILVDPKRVELTCYNGIPHLLCPVIVNPNKTVSALKWAIKEMEERLGKLQEAGARDISSYNSTTKETMPYIVIIIDELADLMTNNANDIETGIVRIAQMARAVGIHLIVSTQRPSVEVITGLIKANIPTRIAFRVASQVDSRTILDSSGAEKLLGNGDMLFLPGNLNKPKRVQNAFLTEEEVRKIVKHLKSQKKISSDSDENTLGEGDSNNPEDLIADAILNTSSTQSNSDSTLEDDLYEDAKEIVYQAGKASASLLQRKLRIGYARAARLIDILEDQKIIGPPDGARPRNVFYNKDNQDNTEQINE